MGLLSFFINSAHAGEPDSPSTTPFSEPLFIPPVLMPTTLDPRPGECPVDGEAERRCHQGWDDYPPEKEYELVARKAPWSFHSELPESEIFGWYVPYLGETTTPGPIIDARYGEPIVVRFRNELPEDHEGFGTPQITEHLHNSHSASESDGFPADYYDPGYFKDHHYPNIYAGGDSREALGTLWFHDHRMFFTGANVYRGLIGFYRLFDDVDSGDETDTSDTALRLPSGEYDVPLELADKRFDDNGYLWFDEFAFDGFLGDKFTVNGRIQPYFEVARRKYRFRILDAGPSRFYVLALVYRDEHQPYYLIGNDGNLLPEPIEVETVRMGVAERADIVVDFSRFSIGDKLYLVNRLEQDDGRGPDGYDRDSSDWEDLDESDWLLEFRVDHDVDSDPSRLPDKLRELPPVDLDEVVTKRTWNFERTEGAWAINDKFFDPDRVDAAPEQGTAEVWTIRNNSGGWAHPVHIHLEEFQILEHNGEPPTAPELQGRKDVVRVGPNEEYRVFMRFRDWVGRYPIHCHNTMHEDHAMMTRWDVTGGESSSDDDDDDDDSTADVTIDRAECDENSDDTIDLRVEGTTSGTTGEVTVEDADTGTEFGKAEVDSDGDYRFDEELDFSTCPDRVRVIYEDAEATATVE